MIGNESELGGGNAEPGSNSGNKTAPISPKIQSLPAPDPSDPAHEYFRAELTLALWRLRWSENLLAYANAAKFLDDHGLDVLTAEEILRTKRRRR